jgi:hypothetical protein
LWQARREYQDLTKTGFTEFESQTMTKATGNVAAIHELLRYGEVAAEWLDALPSGLALGLWSHSTDGSRVVATPALVRMAARLPVYEETAAAVFACETRHRTAWLSLLAARVRDAGRRRDVAELCHFVEQVGVASTALRGLLSAATLKPTGFGELETALFGAPADQAIAVPRLLRAVAATADLIEGGQGVPAFVPADLTPLDPSKNWAKGRLIRLPDHEEPCPTGSTAVLCGSVADLEDSEVGLASEKARQGSMLWVLCRPWPLLLAQVVFTQEAWAAERIEGGMALEIDEAQLNRLSCPAVVHVAVTTPDGMEVVCGTLAELLLRVLAYLGVTPLAPPSCVNQLDDRLGPVIQRLLEWRVWRFDDRSAAGRRPGYQIHDEFSDACYRAFGSNRFYRLGSPLTAAVRSTSEAWARERLDQATRTAPRSHEAVL